MEIRVVCSGFSVRRNDRQTIHNDLCEENTTTYALDRDSKKALICKNDYFFADELILFDEERRRQMHTPHVVLVHGAWADGSCWSKVIEHLQSAGYTVTAAQIPLTSLADDIATVQRVIQIQTAPTILVAHAFGGAVITGLGKDALNVVGLIYISAFVPAEGDTMKSLVTNGPQPAGAAAIRPDTLGFIWLDRDGFARYFAPDVDPLQARRLAAVQKPIAVSSFLGDEPFGEPAWKSLPSWYVITERDQMLGPATQRLMAQRAGATISSIAASHAVMITHPDEIADLIIKAAKAI